MLISIIGGMREGKTSLLNQFAINSDKEIWANFKIKIPNYHPLEPFDLAKLPNNIDVFITEAYAWLESRRSGSDINTFTSSILFQSAKRTIDIYLDLQLLSALDIRFRTMSNYIIEANNLVDIGLFKYDIYKQYKGQLFYIKSMYEPYEYAEIFYKYYDTYEIVESVGKNKFEINYIEQNPVKLLEYVLKIMKDIRKDLENNYTHDNIRYCMIKKGYINELKLEKYIYLYLKKEKENDNI